jgi:hypothetical protein
MAKYQITTSRSDMAEVAVVTRHRVDAARQCYAALVWASCAGRACSIDRSPIVSLTARCAAPGHTTEFAPFTITFTRS